MYIYCDQEWVIMARMVDAEEEYLERWKLHNQPNP